MAVEGVMVSYNYSEDRDGADILTVSASGIKFSQRWVLTHGSILSPLKQASVIQKAKGKPILNEEFYCNLPEMYVTCEKRSKGGGGEAGGRGQYEAVERLSRERSIDNEADFEHASYQIRVLTGRICHVWQCPILDRCVDDILYSWTIGHRDGDVEKQTQLGKALLSVFVLVDLENDDRVVPFRTLRPLSELLDMVRPPPVRGAAVEVHSTPFGCEVFLNAVTRGSVCGVVGKKPSLVLTDAATALGSEGGPVFTEGPTKELIGTVVCSVSWWRGEWVGLTLAAPLVSVLSAKLRVEPQKVNREISNQPHAEILERIDSTTVLVRCGAAWGAGVHLGGGYVLTCAHVVKNYTSHKISLYCQGVKETAIVRYKTPDDKAYDLALLFTNPQQWKHLTPAVFAEDLAEKGESVLAAGYPYFNERNLDDLKPTVTAGHINNVSPSMLQTSCCVQSGFSGGPIYRLSKNSSLVEVMGIIVSNAKTQTGACYPYINMAVPAKAFKSLLQHFALDKGMEVFCEFCGPCLAAQNAVRKGKLEIGQDRIAMAKALADNIEVLERFRGKSEPVFLFIFKGKLTRAMFGANGIELCRIIEEELGHMQHELDTGVERRKQEISHMLPEEAVKLEEDLKMEEECRETTERLRVLTLAARKRRVCDRMSRNMKHVNFILFWPHCHKAHYDLYEKWDHINISVSAKETMQITEEGAREALYMGDVDPNEACLYSLMKGEALIVLFKMMDSDNRDFVKLLRYALYEEIPVPKEDVPPEKQVPPIPAYERYASISKTAREVRRDRYEAKLAKLREEKEERDRLAAEQARLEREAEEERLYQEKVRQEEERMARIQAGLPADPEPEVGEEVEGEQEDEEAKTEVTVTEVVEEEKVEEEEEFHSDVEVEDEEYIPPGGLFVPGLYAPPNELAKANGLTYFFPKVVRELTPIETEHLPPHVLVIFGVDKRYDVQDIMNQYADEMLNYGIFVGDDPNTAEHVAYTIKQYDKMERLRKHKDRLALMVSRKRSLPLLQLAGLNPCYISSDVDSGERDCLTMFPVGYGDDYEEEESVKEEEVVETEPEPVVPAQPEETEEPKPADEENPEDEDED